MDAVSLLLSVLVRTLSIYSLILLVRVLLSWFPNLDWSNPVLSTVLEHRFAAGIEDLGEDIGVNHGPLAGVDHLAPQGIATGSAGPPLLRLGAQIGFGAGLQPDLPHHQVTGPGTAGHPNQGNQEHSGAAEGGPQGPRPHHPS